MTKYNLILLRFLCASSFHWRYFFYLGFAWHVSMCKTIFSEVVQKWWNHCISFVYFTIDRFVLSKTIRENTKIHKHTHIHMIVIFPLDYRKPGRNKQWKYISYEIRKGTKWFRLICCTYVLTTTCFHREKDGKNIRPSEREIGKKRRKKNLCLIHVSHFVQLLFTP